MDELKKVKVEIFGESFTISGDADEEYIIQLAREVDAKMHEVAGTMKSQNPRKVAILTALNLADELKQQGPQADPNLSDKAQNLIRLLDEGIVGDFY